MSEPVVIELPWRVPPLTLNQRPHWAVKNSQTQAIRDVVRALAIRLVPLDPPVRVVLLWTVTNRRRRDTDNPSLTTKACIDGLVDAGFLPADHWEIVPDSHCEIRLGDAPGLKLLISQLPNQNAMPVKGPQKAGRAIRRPLRPIRKPPTTPKTPGGDAA